MRNIFALLIFVFMPRPALIFIFGESMALLIPDLVCKTVYEIPIKYFTDKGIRLLLLDIDNTLVTYDDEYPTEENKKWFKLVADNGIDIVFISNNKEDRVKKYAEKTGYCYYAGASKPRIKYYREAMRKRKLEPNQCAAVGDQIFTDVLAAHFAGCPAVFVYPIKDKQSAFFKLKRKLEIPFLALYLHRNKK